MPTPASPAPWDHEDDSPEAKYWRQRLSMQALIEQLLAGKTMWTAKMTKTAAASSPPLPSIVVRSTSKAAHELMHQQALSTLASALREANNTDAGPVRLVPLALSMTRIAELLADEQSAKMHPRALIIKAFEMEHPGHADVLKQAMEMRSLVVVADVRDESDLAGLKDTVLEELALNRLLLTCCVPLTNESKPLVELLPSTLSERSEGWDISSIGLMLSDLKMTSKNSKDIFRRLRMRADGNEASMHYTQVNALHLAAADLGRDGLQMLQDLLIAETCTLQSLDLSYTQFDGYSLVQALRTNSSLTALDVRCVAGMDKLYQTLSEVLLQPECRCRLGCLR